MISKNSQYVKRNIKNWNKKTEISIGNNRLYKIIGAGPKAFKVLKFEPQPETLKPGWIQTFWRYDELSEIGEAVITVVAKSLSEKTQSMGQQTLD